MELWRTDVIEGRRPAVLSAFSVSVAVVLHLAVFAAFAAFAVAGGLFEKKEVVVPIDLSVVVNENLDGVEGEPPPLVNPAPPEPPKPKPAPKPEPESKKPEPPKPLEQIVTNVVKKAETKPKKPPKKDKPKKKDDSEKKPEKPEKPKKTAKELREERMKRIRAGTKSVSKPVAIEVKGAKASGNGKTARQTMTPEQIRAMLNAGYRPGTENRLAGSEEQRCLSLVQMAIEDRWDAMKPKVGRDGTVLLQVRFNSAGGFSDVRLQSGCGDALSDQAALAVARSVTSVRGLSAEFVAKFSKEPLTVRYNVRGR